jgi:PAS domain S-box-containing protein
MRRAFPAGPHACPEYLRQLLSSLPGLVWTTTADGAVDFVGEQWLEYTGAAFESQLGEGALALVHEDDRSGTHRAWRAAVEGRAQFHVEYRLRRRDGEYRWFNARATPIRDGEGRIARWFGFSTDIDALKRSEETLRASEQRYRSLFENMTEGFAVGEVVCDDEGVPRDVRFLEMNDACEAQTGMRRRDVEGRPMREVLPHLEKTWIDAWIEVALTGRPTRFESYNVDLDRHFACFCFSPARGRFAVLFDDVTDRRRAEEEVRAANARLLEADRRKDEFLGMLSHELRNPLAPIRNSIYVLEHTDPDGEQGRRARAVIQRQAEHLTRLVDDLLDVTRIARGKIELRRERADLASIVRRTVEDQRSVVTGRGVRLVTGVPDEVVWASVDSTRISQVVGNLLQNAAKFTPRGGSVAVSLRAARGAAELRVSDTGVGIEQGLLEHVFEPFVQGERSLARTQGGLGLGLALVKGITELHGGTVSAESRGSGKGAEIVVRLPLAAPESRRDAPAANVPGPAKGRRVLVVDDNRDAAESLAELVELFGHTAEVAYDGPSAIAKARASLPEVVLCDIGLPGMNGYDIAKALRADGGDVQLIAVSGYAQPEDLDRAADAGFDGHVAKPPDPAQIERLLA